MWSITGDGRIVDEPDTTGMNSPYRCLRCGHVHDVGLITDYGRYSDCTTWKCPNCKSLIDDRPVRWGGSAEPVTAKRGW